MLGALQLCFHSQPACRTPACTAASCSWSPSSCPPSTKLAPLWARDLMMDRPEATLSRCCWVGLTPHSADADDAAAAAAAIAAVLFGLSVDLHPGLKLLRRGCAASVATSKL
jgi:hypothetical protein